MTDTILFLGKYDEHLLNLEKSVVKFDKNDELDMPDVVKKKKVGYDCDVWVIIGDVKPTLLLKDLISKATIIIFCYNLSNSESLDFLIEGWEPIVQRAIPNYLPKEQKNDETKQQTRLLVGIQSDTDHDLELSELVPQIENTIERLHCDKYFEYSPTKNRTNNYNEFKFPISTNLIEYLHNQFKKNKIEEQKNNKNKDEENKIVADIEEEDKSDHNFNDNAVEEEEAQENIENEEAQDFRDKNSVNYKLYEQSKIAHIIESPIEKVDIFIPTVISYKSIDFKVTKICEKAFANAKIQSLSFATDPCVKVIENSVFYDSTITTLFIPKSLTKLENLWCQGAKYLNEIEVDKENRYFSVRDGFLYYKKDGINEILFAPRNFEGDFIVPKDVTRIGDYAFTQRNGLTSIESAPCSKLKMIGSHSFYECENLKSVSFKQNPSLTLGTFCFSKSNNLKSVTFKEMKEVKLNAQEFKNCQNLENVSITNVSDIQIGKECFCCLNKLNSIEFISDSINLGDDFVSKCNSLTKVNIQSKGEITILSNSLQSNQLKSVILHSQKLKLSSYCFKGLKCLESIEIETDNLEIRDDCFKDCPSLSTFKYKSNKDISIDKTKFIDCPSLKELALEAKSEIKIPNEFMSGYKNLESVMLNGLRVEIGNLCFKDCDSLITFTICESDRIKIGDNQFRNCKKLESISIQLLNANSKIEFGKFCLNGATGLKIFNLIGGDVTINNDLFKFCTSLEQLFILSASKVVISDNQFANLKELQDVDIESESEVSLGTACFSKSDKLESAKIAGKTSITLSNSCFKDCTSLSKIEITGATDLFIGTYAFSNCHKLEEVDFRVSKKLKINDGCFKKSNVKTALFNGETVEIGNECFKDVTSIIQIGISSQTLEIGKSAFEGCKSLQAVRLESASKLKINDNCFSGDKAIQSFELSGETVNICISSFYKCTSIKSLNLPASKRVILGNKAFEGCSGISNVFVTATEDFQAGVCCFSDSTNLSTVQITSKKVTISRLCFSNCQCMKLFTISAAEEASLCESSFENCRSITTVEVYSSEKFKADNFCFNNAASLKTVKTSSKNVSFGCNCFKNCSSLKTVNSQSATQITCYRSSFNGKDYKMYLKYNPNTPIKAL